MLFSKLSLGVFGLTNAVPMMAYAGGSSYSTYDSSAGMALDRRTMVGDDDAYNQLNTRDISYAYASADGVHKFAVSLNKSEVAILAACGVAVWAIACVRRQGLTKVVEDIAKGLHVKPEEVGGKILDVAAKKLAKRVPEHEYAFMRRSALEQDQMELLGRSDLFFDNEDDFYWAM